MTSDLQNWTETTAPKNIDAYIAQINHVKEHPEADRLELAYIRNWQCVIAKDSLKTGDWVLFVQPDAMLPEKFDDERLTNKWTDNIRTYLGRNGRVKIVSLRNKLSNGLIISIDSIKEDFANNYAIDYAKGAVTDEAPYSKTLEESVKSQVMSLLHDEFLRLLQREITPIHLCKILGIEHYTAPIPQDLSAQAVGMPPGVEKSDEENFQSMSESKLHLGEECLVTRKMDGSSGTIYYDPEEDELSVHSRSLKLWLDKNNNYTNAMLPLKDCIIALAKHYGEPIALRGEVCGNGINANKANKDAKGDFGFYIYGVRFPRNADSNIRFGRWKSGRHFLDVVEQANKLGFFNLKTVPILGTAIITMDKLREWENAPAEDGEGVVVNGAWNDGDCSSSYKAKSALYYAKMK